jgi:hypothetical protein
MVTATACFPQNPNPAFSKAAFATSIPLRVSFVPPDFEMTMQRVLLKSVANGGQNTVHAVGIGVVEKERFEFVRARIAQRVGDKLRAQRGTANADEQIIFERAARAANFTA